MNKKIKIIAFFLMLIVCFGGSFIVTAQLIVNDPTANATQAKSLALTKLSIAESKKQVTLLEKTIKRLRQINSKLNELSMLENAIKTQKYTIQRSKAYAKQLQQTRMFKPSEINIMVGNFNTIIASSARTIKVINLVMKNNGLEMSDGERLKQLDQAVKDVNDHRVAVDMMNRTYRRVAMKRATYSFMGKRKR